MRAPRSNRSTRTISCTNWIDVRVSGAMVVVNRVTPAPETRSSAVESEFPEFVKFFGFRHRACVPRRTFARRALQGTALVLRADRAHRLFSGCLSMLRAFGCLRGTSMLAPALATTPGARAPPGLVNLNPPRWRSCRLAPTGRAAPMCAASANGDGEGAAETSSPAPSSAHRGPSVKRTPGARVRRTADPTEPSHDFHGRRRVKQYVRHATAKDTGGETRFPYAHDSFNFDGYETDIPELTEAFTPLVSPDRLARLEVVAQRSFDPMPILEGVYDIGTCSPADPPRRSASAASGSSPTPVSLSNSPVEHPAVRSSGRTSSSGDPPPRRWRMRKPAATVSSSPSSRADTRRALRLDRPHGCRPWERTRRRVGRSQSVG